MKTISHDLIRDIVQWVPKEDLLMLSKVDVIFTKEICAAGIRLMYFSDKIINLRKAKYTIIQKRTGKKDVLLYKDGKYWSIYYEKFLDNYEISFKDESEINYGVTYEYYDNGYLLLYAQYCKSYVYINYQNLYVLKKKGLKLWRDGIYIRNYVTNCVGIDMNSKIIIGNHEGNSYETFKVVWNNDRWV